MINRKQMVSECVSIGFWDEYSTQKFQSDFDGIVSVGSRRRNLFGGDLRNSDEYV